jgi:hypothetical protein
MKYLHNMFFENDPGAFAGLEDVVFAVVSGYPNKDVCADIRRDGKSYSFEFMKSLPSSTSGSLPLSSDHAGYLFSKHLRGAFDVDFERCLQPSIYDLRSMYELGDSVRAFLATNGVGWAFRLFDFQDASLAESNWFDSGFIKSMRNAESLRSFTHFMPQRIALSMLRQDERMVRFLVNESRAIGERINRPQVTNRSIPSELLAGFLLVGTSVVMVGEAFLQRGELQSDEVFEHHLIEAFNAVKQDDAKSAFEEVLKFSLPSVHALSGLEGGETKLRKIKEINSRLHELRLPRVAESRKLNALIAFLEDILDCAYSLLTQGSRKVKTRLKQRVNLDRLQMLSEDQYLSHQPVPKEQQVPDGAREFMAEATSNYPNVVLGKIRRYAEESNRYLITDFRVLPCDVMIKYSATVSARNGSAEQPSGQPYAGIAVSKVCCCEHEMLILLHPETRTLNEMLRSGYSLNAIAVTNGNRCLFRLHDGSNNTLASAHTV